MTTKKLIFFGVDAKQLYMCVQKIWGNCICFYITKKIEIHFLQFPKDEQGIINILQNSFLVDMVASW